jgi:hypothetical protein
VKAICQAGNLLLMHQLEEEKIDHLPYNKRIEKKAVRRLPLVLLSFLKSSKRIKQIKRETRTYCS